MKKRKTKNNYRISDKLWEKIEPLILKHPNTHRFSGGRPRVADCKAIDGIFFVLREKESQGMCLDKDYDSGEVRDLVKEFGYTANIHSRGEEAQAIKREAGFKVCRWVVERTHSWMNRFRRILTQWGKKPEKYLALLHFVCAIITFSCSGLFG